MVEVTSPKEVLVKNTFENKSSKKFTFDKAFGPESKQSEVYQSVVAPLIEEVLAGYNCTVFAYGQTGTGKTHTMVGDEIPTMVSSWEDVRTYIIFNIHLKKIIHFFLGFRIGYNTPCFKSSISGASYYGR